MQPTECHVTWCLKLLAAMIGQQSCTMPKCTRSALQQKQHFFFPRMKLEIKINGLGKIAKKKKHHGIIDVTKKSTFTLKHIVHLFVWGVTRVAPFVCFHHIECRITTLLWRCRADVHTSVSVSLNAEMNTLIFCCCNKEAMGHLTQDNFPFNQTLISSALIKILHLTQRWGLESVICHTDRSRLESVTLER